MGGAEEVGRLAIKITDGDTKVLVDYGVIPDKPPEYPMPPEPVSDIFVTHAHLDHIGALPLYYQGASPTIHATLMTANSMKPLLDDSVKIMNLEGYPVRFNKDDVSSLFAYLDVARYGETQEVGRFQVTPPYSAGHIPGSTMWMMEDSRSILVTGDLYTRDTKLLVGAKPVKSDILIMESTYAGRNHEDREQVMARLKARIKEVIDDGGRVILPTFAVGRTQELIMNLADTGYEIYVDGMGGNSITSIYLNTNGFLRSKKEFQRALEKVIEVRGGNRMRQRALKSDIIITTSGMLDGGGPALFYIQNMLNDRKSAIFLTGYQVEGTNGRLLLESGTMNIAGAAVKPEMKVEFFDLSAHAGHDDLVSFVKQVDPETVVLCHGDQREKLQEALEGYNVVLPFNGREIEV